MAKDMKILVTGGAGFIGSHLVRELVLRGEDVVVLDSMEEQVHNGAAPDLPDAVEMIEGNVGDAEMADRALTGVDRVVHLAAAVGVGQSMYEIARYTELNTMATARFLERLVAHGHCRLDSSSHPRCPSTGRANTSARPTAAVAPPAPGGAAAGSQWELYCPQCRQPLSPVPTSETKPLLPTSIYAINKRDHEEMSLVTGAAYGIPTVALRFFNVYGPGQALSNPYTGVAAIFASRLLNERSPMIFEDGEQSSDFIHVSTSCEESSWRLSPKRRRARDQPRHRAFDLGGPRRRGPRRRHRRRRRPPSSTSSTGRETSATATPIPAGPRSCSASARRSLRAGDGSAGRVAAGPTGGRSRR